MEHFARNRGTRLNHEWHERDESRERGVSGFRPFREFRGSEIAADRVLYQRQIEATDRQIDALVYELYGLTEEEIAVVEG